jgi:hypothetical protein
MTDMQVLLLSDEMDITRAEFAGPLSSSYENDFSGVLPPGEYEVVANGIRSVSNVASPSLGDVAGFLELRPSADGGRKSPTPAEAWRCTLRIDGEYRDCRMVFGEGDRGVPGRTTSARVRFLTPEAATAVRLGEPVEVWEGRMVGQFVPCVLI